MPVYRASLEPSPNRTPPRPYSQLSKDSERKSIQAAQTGVNYKANILNSRSASRLLDHASSARPNDLSNVTSKTQKELYKAELAKVWDIVYKER